MSTDPLSERPEWTKDLIVYAIRRWTKQTGHPPTMAEWNKEGENNPGRSRVQRTFGSWSRAIEQAVGFEVQAPESTSFSQNTVISFQRPAVRHLVAVEPEPAAKVTPLYCRQVCQRLIDLIHWRKWCLECWEDCWEYAAMTYHDDEALVQVPERMVVRRPPS